MTPAPITNPTKVTNNLGGHEGRFKKMDCQMNFNTG